MNEKPPLPKAMLRDGRDIDPHFEPGERLFRRVITTVWSKRKKLGIDAIELPDTSVERSKYSHAEWARFAPERDKFYGDWGGVSFRADEIPAVGDPAFSFEAHHSPNDVNYPHSEVRAFKEGVHLTEETDVPEIEYMLWRQTMLERLRPEIEPGKPVRIREEPPTSIEPLPPEYL